MKSLELWFSGFGGREVGFFGHWEKGFPRAESFFSFAGAPAPPAASKAPLVPSPVLQSPSEGLGLGAGPACPLPALAGGEAFPFPSPEQGLALSGAGFPGMLGALPLPLSLGQPPPSPLLSHSLFGVLAGGGGQPPPEPLLPPSGGPCPPADPHKSTVKFFFFN